MYGHSCHTVTNFTGNLVVIRAMALYAAHVRAIGAHVNIILTCRVNNGAGQIAVLDVVAATCVGVT